MDFEKLSRELYEKATPEERARIDRRRAELAEDQARPRVTVDAVRTNCHTGEVKTAWPIVLVVRPGFGDQDWLFIDGGGVTGYESIPVTSVEDAIRQGKAWSACHGTEGRWDGLLVPVESLRAALEALVPGRVASGLSREEREASGVPRPSEATSSPAKNGRSAG